MYGWPGGLEWSVLVFGNPSRAMQQTWWTCHGAKKRLADLDSYTLRLGSGIFEVNVVD
jgi:hypothetical protein